MKNRKKGFTVVELVIVIAVIGILSAVLIPVFSGLIAKANLANDNSIVSNINTQLKASEITDGKNVTMFDALQDAKEAGYLVQNINAKSNNQLVWDSTIDRFALIDAEGNVISGELRATKDYDLWKISNVVDAKYSTYYTGNETTINTSKGFDAGENTTISTINYSNSGTAQDVVIRTNGGKLVIDASESTVHHYGEAEHVDIIAVSLGDSYHVYGRVGYVELAKGHFVAENGARVMAVVNTGSADEVKLDAASTAIVDVAISTNSSASSNAHGGNLNITYEELTETEKEEIIYNAEAKAVNALLVDNAYYKTLDDVFKKAPAANGNGYDLSESNSIIFLKDLEGGGLFIPDSNKGGTIIIDFNGYSYTITSAVGSSNTASQAMHFGASLSGENINLTLKNGSILVKKDAPGINMGLQNYANLTFENMIIDISTIATKYYGKNQFSGNNAKYNGLEMPLLNNNYANGRASITLRGCTVKCPSTSNTGVYFEGTNNSISNSTIEGYVTVSSDCVKGSVSISNSSITKGVKAYFAADTIDTVEDTSSTTYKIH